MTARPLTLLAVPFAVTMALAACGSSSTPDATRRATAEGGGRVSAQEIVKQVTPETVSIVTQPRGESKDPTKHGRHAHGSGVIWDAGKGRVLTSNHLVENAGKITVTVNGTTKGIEARRVARAQCNDVAVLELKDKPSGLTGIKVDSSADLEIGDPVTAVGYLKSASAKHASLIVTSGTVSARNVPFAVSDLLPDLPSAVLHQAPVATQMSGGALVNDRGRFVGLLTLVPGEPSTGVFAAVSSDYLYQRIAQLKEGRNGRLRGWKDQHRCHGKMLTIAGRVLVSHGPPGKHEH
jgi:S1-C subfamily serine protease